MPHQWRASGGSEPNRHREPYTNRVTIGISNSVTICITKHDYKFVT